MAIRSTQRVGCDALGRALLLATTVLAAVYAYWQLRLVESGSLFVVALAMDAPASTSEIEDARKTARLFAAPAVVVVVAIGLLLIARAPRIRIQAPNSRAWRIAAVALLVAAIADAATTAHFFHVNGIDYELHPGIRLFGYAYGRTVGPILGKMVQLVGLLFLASLNARLGTFLLWFVSALYVAAAIYNATTIRD